MLNVMIVGAGGIAPFHIEGFLRYPELAKITALAAVDLPRAESLKKQYGLDCKVIADYAGGLTHCDAVAICTPPSSHREIACGCLLAGKHVLLEKPMAPTLEECDAILAAAEQSGKVFSVVAQSHFINDVANVIKLVKSGEYGKPRFTAVKSCWYRGGSYFDLFWRGRWSTEGGGCTMSQAVHHVDLLLWANGMPERVTAVMTNMAHDNSEEEDVSVAILQYADGSLATLTCSTLHHGEEQTFDFQMEKAGVAIPFAAKVNGSRSNGFPLVLEEETQKIEQRFRDMPRVEHEYHAGQIGNFLDAVRGKAAIEVTGAQGRAAIELIMAIYCAAVTKRPVSLPLEKSSGFYLREDFLRNIVRFHEKTRDVAEFADKSLTTFETTK